MAHNPSRFVIIDGVQILRTRAEKLGLIDEKGAIVKHDGKIGPDGDASESAADDTSSVDGPSNTRSRGASTSRKG